MFDAQWRSSTTGGIANDVIEFRRVENGSVVLRRYQYTGTILRTISRDGTRIVRGAASRYALGRGRRRCAPPALHFEPKYLQPIESSD